VSIGRGLNRELRVWQRQALDQWRKNGNRGIIEAATGTGKTTVALAAVDALNNAELRVAIVVPKIVLVDQWRTALRDTLGVQPRDVGGLGGGGEYAGQRVVVAVINSARSGLRALVENWRKSNCHVLLVVDECHWSGSKKNSMIFEVRADWTLGLSATPERNDDGLDEVLEPQLGPVVFRYPLLRALDDGVLAPLSCINLYIRLESDEQADYDEHTDRILKMRMALEERYPELKFAGDKWPIVLNRLAAFDIDAEMLMLVMLKRRRLVSSARQRQACLKSLIAAGALEGRKSILFHETIETAEASVALLRGEEYQVFVDHSKLMPKVRGAAIKGLSSQRRAVLVAVRTVDEGIDVSDAEMAVILSGTLTPRQRIQRIGRILRPSGKATCFSLLARGTSEETMVGAKDAQLVGAGRVRHYSWPKTSTSQIIGRAPSTYEPTEANDFSVFVPGSAQDEDVPPACPSCGYRQSGVMAKCARCGQILDERKARRMEETYRKHAETSRSGTPRSRGSMADDPRYKRCPHCNWYIPTASKRCRFCKSTLS
jgi:superfamily II DNA or RNA helicase